MSTLTGNTVAATYSSLIKVGDNTTINNTLKPLSDGLGTQAALSVSTTAVQISGSLVVLGGITGSLSGSITSASYALTASTATSASYALTASYAMNGGGGVNINTGSFATTGSNTFIGNQVISGSINFGDGSLIQSVSQSSGDGLGASTLQLNPDTNLGTDQYIVLDPTSPNHIHIRAGGTIDSSSAYLYLGGEKANVVVRNLDNSFNEKYWVQINSQTGSTQSTWVFDDNGNTIFPSLTTPRGDNANGDLTTNTLKLGDGTDQAVISTPNGTAAFPNSQRLVINPGQGSGSSEGGDIYLWAGRGGVEGGTGGDVKVRGGYGPLSGSGGYVRIEGGNTDDGSAGFVEIRGGDSINAMGGEIYLIGGRGNNNNQNANVYVHTYDFVGTLKTWTFDTSGSLSVPGTITGASNLATTGSNAFTGNQIISGSINFGDGSLIQSVSASSGDGNGYTTLVLKPDESLGTDQYIILDPTAPSHIHVRAGGTIDASSVYLYLGGENNNVRVSDSGNIEISSTGTITTRTGSAETGLKLDFVNSTYTLGDFNDSNSKTKVLVDDANQLINVTGSLLISGTFVVPTSSSLVLTGSMYVEPASNKLWIYTGNGGVDGWVTSSLG